MGNFMYYNYIAGTIMFLIDRLLLRIKRTKEQEKQIELDAKKSLEDLETQSGVLWGTGEFATKLHNKLLKLKSNVWTRQLVMFILFQIPFVNIYTFISSMKIKINS